jgi:small subunit ribosomal protein S1
MSWETINEPRPRCLDTFRADLRRRRPLTVSVTRVLAYGAQVEVVAVPGVEGLIHANELSERHVADPRDIVREQQILEARIAKIDASRHRLGLSLRTVPTRGD